MLSNKAIHASTHPNSLQFNVLCFLLICYPLPFDPLSFNRWDYWAKKKKKIFSPLDQLKFLNLNDHNKQVNPIIFPKKFLTMMKICSYAEKNVQHMQNTSWITTFYHSFIVSLKPMKYSRGTVIFIIERRSNE